MIWLQAVHDAHHRILRLKQLYQIQAVNTDNAQQLQATIAAELFGARPADESTVYDRIAALAKGQAVASARDAQP